MTARGLALLAAGGTGGHVFPARALAEALLVRQWQVAFVTDERGLSFADDNSSFAVHQIKAASLGGSACNKLKGLAHICVGLLQARALLRRLRPDCVAGFGGYPSVPAMMAATMADIPTLIHEQNAVLGRANRLLAPRVNGIATAYQMISHIKETDRRKIVLTGNPVRPEIAALTGTEMQDMADGKLRVLILGGSQGARILSDVIPEAVAALPRDERDRLVINQQCRPEDIDRVRAAYAAADMSPRLETFFDDVPDLLATSHLVISRAGASTIAELTAAGRPAILIPYAHATDDHQMANAREIEEAGGAWVIPQAEFTREALLDRLTICLSSPSLMMEAGRKAAAAGHPDAAERLADALETLAIPAREEAA